MLALETRVQKNDYKHGSYLISFKQRGHITLKALTLQYSYGL